MSETYDHPRVVSEKEQVKHLHSQLKKAAVDISIGELYNIWAHIHGSSDWKSHIKKLQMPTAPPGPTAEDKDLWSITTTDFSGFPTVTLAIGMNNAIATFLQNSFMYVNLLSEAVLRVVGEEDDAALSGLHLIAEGDKNSDPTCLMSLVRPQMVELQEGISPFEMSTPPHFVRLGLDLDATLAYFKGRIKETDRIKCVKSLIAHQLMHPFAKEILKGAKPRQHVSDEKMNRLWDYMQSVRIWATFTANII
jgi:hypothetical protein